MTAYRLLLASLLIPALALAREPNPFVLPAIQKKSPPPLNVFQTPLVQRSRGSAPAERLPVPPLPPPISEFVSGPVRLDAKGDGTPAQSPAQRPQAERTCVIARLPAVPLQERAGGGLVLRLSDSASHCIAGIEAEDDWVRIKFFNGRELHLEIDPNPGTKTRESVLVFASMTDSQLLRVRQMGTAGPSAP